VFPSWIFCLSVVVGQAEVMVVVAVVVAELCIKLHTELLQAQASK
jgi:hypothetical protein